MESIFFFCYDIIQINTDVVLLKQMIRGIMMDILQEYKELYYKEIEFKDAMNNKIGTSITFLTVLSTGHKCRDICPYNFGSQNGFLKEVLE